MDQAKVEARISRVIDQIGAVVEDLASIAADVPTTADMSDLDMSLMYCRHCLRHLRGGDER